MAPAGLTFQRVEQPSEAQVDAAVDLMADLMKDDAAIRSLVGGNISQVGPMARAMLRAGVHCGEYYEARNDKGDMAGYLMTVPPGEDLFSTEEQRAMGLTEFMNNLSEEGKQYYKTTYLAEFPAFVNKCLGPTGKKDSWYIHMVMVRREYQGQGIATNLIKLVREKAKLGGDTIAMSTTTEVNSIIYQKIGLKLLDMKIMPSPWGDWPLYILSLDTRTT